MKKSPIKNGLIGEFNGFEYYKEGKPLFTTFTNEITGNFYPRPPMPRKKKVLITLAVLLVAYFTFDWFFPEVVTEVLSEAVMLFR